MTPMTRRHFLAGAAASPLILSHSFAADAKNESPNTRLGIGFIGMGIQSRGHVNFCLGAKECQVLAVCDVDKTRREAAKKIVEARYADAAKSGMYKGCDAYN